MSLYEWTSVGDLQRPAVRYFVAKYDRRIRKSVALVRATASYQEVVAYFRSEDQAIAFCDEVLGGRVSYEAPQ